MISTSRMSLVAAGVALVCSTAATVARADAVAQSILNVSNFHFAAGNGAGRNADGSLVPFISVANATTTADASGDLNGVSVSHSDSQNDPLSFVGASSQATVGNSATYSPGVVLVGSPVATFVGATSTQAGNALFGTTSALTDGIVSLKPAGDGSTNSNVNFQADFSFAVNAANTKVEIAFDASSYLRAMLSSTGIGGAPTATASYSFTISIVNGTGAEVFSWTPDGSVGSGITGGVEYADAFKMTDTRSVLNVKDFSVTNATGSFEAETNGLAIGDYTVSIRQIANSDAFLKVPEPASLALLGAAMMGAGFAGRRRAKK